MTEAPTCIAIDWSGAANEVGQRRHIVAATVRDGRVLDVVAGRTRSEVVHSLHAIGPARGHAPTFVGLDFSFSVPAWFARSHGCQLIDEVWELVAARGEQWLADCPPPFWGHRATRCQLVVNDRYRECEQRLRAQHRQPKSVFQIAGAGAVGTGSLRGMPWLAWLRTRGFAIWPLDAAGQCTALEVYPSLYAQVATNDAAGRAAHLARFAPDVLGAREREIAIAGDDAFDAVVSALAMWEQRDALLALEATTDPTTALEGAVWY